MKHFLKYRKTYNAGLLYAKAFRVLKKKTNEVLQPLGVNATDWGILGILIGNKEGVALKVI